MTVVNIATDQETGLKQLSDALIAKCRETLTAVLISCDYCGNDDGPFDIIDNQLVETPFILDYAVLTVSRCRDCFQ